MTRIANKSTRLQEIETLLLAHPEGMTQKELSERLGVNRTTISRNLRDLQAPVYEESGRLFLDRKGYLIHLRLSLHEALSLHLASRLLAANLDRQNAHAASALRKISQAMQRLAPRLSSHIAASAEVIDDLARFDNPTYMHVLECLTEGWATSQKIRVWHRKNPADPLTCYLFSPYYIEPGAWGRSTYAIGVREPPNQIRTLKIERIEDAQVEKEPYHIPSDFDPFRLLSDAWGIWFTDEVPVKVVLKFSARVAGRVQETRWHRSQKIQSLPDGTVIWCAHVAAVQEMLPWIRGWGPDVEVLEPISLREEMATAMRAAAEQYGWKVSETEKINIWEGEMIYYAHTRDGDKSGWQTIRTHLENTADLARSLGSDSGTAPFAAVAAMLHDIGKYSMPFQRRLEGSPERVDHATAGAKEIVRLFNQTSTQRMIAGMVAYCIAGHHGGLMDYGSPIDCDTETTLQGRLKRAVCDYQAYTSDIDPSMLVLPERLPIRPLPGSMGFSLAFFTRMIYSTLVDADFIETETFVNGKKPRGEYDDISTLAMRFEEFLRPFEQAASPINRRRTETLKACLARASDPPGLYTLTLPTGGGKTFSSMAFALQHAKQHDLKRIIYVIPYTSIIEQNAAEFKRSLGADAVLEHHSNFDWKRAGREGDVDTPTAGPTEAQAKLRLAVENWDIPIVVTTSVQFFESLFGSKKSRLRKLHNLAKSVILFDEAQMLPRDYLTPCLYAVGELVQNYGGSAVFCTATQPCIEPFLPKGMTLKELIPDPQEQFNFYRRVQVKRTGRVTDEVLLDRLNAHPQALCIVNTRKHAKALYSGLEAEGRYHLSTLMCASHRSKVIAEIRSRLKDALPCRVVSTQLLEAGVDLDFPVGFRALAGLESIVQSAGRVNREGKRGIADLFVFEPDSEHARFLPAYIRQSAAVARIVLEKYLDPVCVAAIQDYYRQLYDLHDLSAFDSQKILACFEKGSTEPAFDFQTAAERFKMIDNDTTAVIIPYNEEAKGLINRLSSAEFPLSIIRALQTYTVNIFEPEYQALVEESAIELYCERFPVLRQTSLYHSETGLMLPEKRGGKAIILEY